MLYDTNFIIALQGRNKHRTRKEAEAWIAENETGSLYLPRLVAIEFQAGMIDDAAGERFLKLFTVLQMEEPVLRQSVRIMRQLRDAGQSIGAADSIIAATAFVYGLKLVTQNEKHFRRVQGIEVVTY